MRPGFAASISVLLAAVALAFAPVASAKGPSSARICGLSGCVTLHGDSSIAGATSLGGGPFELLDPPPPSRYFTIATGGHGYDGRFLFVPSRGLLCIADGQTSPYWREAPPGATRALAHLTRRLRAFPAPQRWTAALPSGSPALSLAG